MRLAIKLTLALTCAILTILSVNAFIRVQRELRLFADDASRDVPVIGRAVAGAAARTWARGSEADAIAVVEDANEREAHVTIRWVRLDQPAGGPRAPVVGAPPVRPGAGPYTTTWTSPADDEMRVTYLAVAGPAGEQAAVELKESTSVERAYIRETVFQVTAATLIVVVVSGLVMLVLGVVLVGRPVRRLVEHARRVGGGDLSARLDLHQRDEIGLLAREMDAMTARLATARADLDAETRAKLTAEEQLRHADRLATVGRLAAGIAHEVGTPLNVITGYAQLIVDDAPGESLARYGRLVGDQAHKVAAIIRQLLDFARPRAPDKQRVQLARIAGQAVEFLANLAQRRGVTVEVKAPGEPVETEADRAQLEQVVTNLVVNAIDATPAGGAPIEVEVSRRRVARPAYLGGGRVEAACLAVHDRGAGIAAADLPRVFDPFFTTKDVGQGTGLGLAVATGIVREHGGWIAVESTPGQGSRFTVLLPLEDAA